MSRSHAAPPGALARGSAFLLARQGRDGLWRDFRTPAGQASEWPTGFVAAALHRAGAPASALERAAETLAAGQRRDGGWGYNEAVPTDADSTASVALFLAGTERGGHAGARAAACLMRHQRAGDGGIATYAEPGPIRRFMGVHRLVRFRGWCRPHTEVTATAGRALAALTPGGGSRAAGAAWSFVRARQDADGSWSAYWWTSPHYATLEAVELALALGDAEPVGRAAEWALRTQRDDGGWSAPSARTSAWATALSVSVLVRAGASREPINRALQRLLALQQDDGGWPSHPIMRIPLPGDADPDGRRRWRVGGRGIVVQDQHRTFTSAACVAALARARDPAA